jgi:hypothetical protein
MLLTSTGDYVKSQDLLKTALDLSAMSGVDVVSVAADLSKAYQGNTRGLMKYQLGLTKTELAAMSFEEILSQVAKVSGGQAQIAADSYAGSLDKLSVASANVSESLGKDLINALTTLGGTGGLPKTLGLIESIASAVGDAVIGFARLIRVIDIITGSGSPIEMIKRLNAFTKEYKAADAAERLAAAGGGGFSSYNAKKAADALALANAKKITKETKSTAAAALAAANAKKLSLAVDKANAALAKGNDIFNLDAIQLNAALINQAEQLGKATTGAQVLAIANDIQRLKIKQDINALEDAIASKDTVAIEKATAKLNEDLKILGALQKQDAKLLDINNVLAGMKSTDLINLANLQAALDLLAKFKFPTLTLPGVTMPGGTSSLNPNAGITFNPNQNKDRNYDQNVLGIGGDMPASLNVPGVDFNPTQNKDRNYTNNVINVSAGVIGDENIIVDAVQNALNEIARRGYLTTYAGAIAG